MPAFLARVGPDGKLAIRPEDKEAFAAFLKQHPGLTLEVSLKPIRAAVSPAMRRYYRGVVVKTLSEHTGYELDEMHRLLVRQFLGVDSTTELAPDEFAQFVNRCIRFAADEFGLYVPPPKVQTPEQSQST